MELKITEKKDEPLLSRTMLKAELLYDAATPSNKDAAALVASSQKVDEKVVVIKHVYGKFGNKKADVIAYVYANEEKKNHVEPKIKVKEAKNEEKK